MLQLSGSFVSPEYESDVLFRKSCPSRFSIDYRIFKIFRILVAREARERTSEANERSERAKRTSEANERSERAERVCGFVRVHIGDLS